LPGADKGRHDKSAPTGRLLRAGAKSDWEVLDSIYYITACRFQCHAGYAFDFMEALKEHGEHNFGFQPCQWRPEAKVNTMSKRNMAVRCPSDIEAVWIGKLRLITVGGTDPGQNHLTRSYLLISDGGIGNGSAIHEL